MVLNRSIAFSHGILSFCVNDSSCTVNRLIVVFSRRCFFCFRLQPYNNTRITPPHNAHHRGTSKGREREAIHLTPCVRGEHISKQEINGKTDCFSWVGVCVAVCCRCSSLTCVSMIPNVCIYIYSDYILRVRAVEGGSVLPMIVVPPLDWSSRHFSCCTRFDHCEICIYNVADAVLTYSFVHRVLNAFQLWGVMSNWGPLTATACPPRRTPLR